MRAVIDLTGQTFSRLTVLCQSEIRKHGQVCWVCRCECGNTVTVRGYKLRSRDTTSCGCWARDRCGIIARDPRYRWFVPKGYEKIHKKHREVFRDRNKARQVTDELARKEQQN